MKRTLILNLVGCTVLMSVLCFFNGKALAGTFSGTIGEAYGLTPKKIILTWKVCDHFGRLTRGKETQDYVSGKPQYWKKFNTKFLKPPFYRADCPSVDIKVIFTNKLKLILRLALTPDEEHLQCTLLRERTTPGPPTPFCLAGNIIVSNSIPHSVFSMFPIPWEQPGQSIEYHLTPCNVTNNFGSKL